MRLRTFGLALCLLAYTPVALAQEAPPPAPPADPPKGNESTEAQEHFQRARALYDEGDFALALVEFKRAYDISPNYRVLYNIGQVNIQLFNYAAARKALEQYMEDGAKDISESRKGQVEADLKMLRERTAYLNVQTRPPADVAIDDAPPVHSPFPEPVLVNAGQRRLTISKQGYVSVTKVVTLAGGDRQDIAVELVKAPTTGGVFVVPQTRVEKNYTPAVVSWSITGALAITSVVLGGLYLNKQSELEDHNNPALPVDAQTKSDLEGSANRYAIAGDIFALTAIVAGGVAVYFTVRPPVKSETTVNAPRVGLTPTGIAGTF